MSRIRQLANFLDAMDPLRVQPVREIVREPNLRLQELLLADRPLTAEEWAYVSACEAAAV